MPNASTTIHTIIHKGPNQIPPPPSHMFQLCMLRSPFESAVLDGRTPLPKLSEINDFSQGGHQIGQGRRCSTLLHWVARFKRHYLCIFLNPKGSVLLIRTNLRTRVATTIRFDQSAGLRSATINSRDSLQSASSHFEQLLVEIRRRNVLLTKANCPTLCPFHALSVGRIAVSSTRKSG